MATNDRSATAGSAERAGSPMTKMRRDDDVARLSGARLVLERMQKQLAQMTKAHVAAEEHLSKLTVDEAGVKKVVRDTPM